MAAREYWDFIHEAQAIFGFDLDEARQYYQEFKEVFTAGEPATLDDLEDFADEAADLADAYFEDMERGEPEFEERYAEEFDQGEEEYDDAAYDLEGDDWIDEGEEVEVTASTRYK